MSEAEWSELEKLTAIPVLDMTEEQFKRVGDLIAATSEIDEHPETYNGGCECKLCMSYGD